MIAISIYLIIGCLVLSAIFSGSESALFSLDASISEKVKRITDDRKKKLYSKILSWIRRPERTLSAILLGNLIVNVIISEAGYTFFERSLGSDFPSLSLISLLSITLTILIFGEIIPKILAVQIAERWVSFWNHFLRIWFAIASAIAWPVIQLARLVTRYIPGSEHKLSEQELLEAVNLADSYGIIKQDERVIIRRSVIYQHDTAYSAMIPQSDLFRITHDISVTKAKKIFLEKDYSFALVFHSKEKKLLGYVHVRDLIIAIYSKQKSIRAAVQNLTFLPETMPLYEVVETLIENKTEMAAVTDESGELSGIILLKSIMCKLMGESDDRFQVRSGIRLTESGSTNIYKIDGSTELNVFNDFFKSNFEYEEIETISGFIIEQLDGFPRSNTKVDLQPFVFSDFELDDYKIKTMKVEVSES